MSDPITSFKMPEHNEVSVSGRLTKDPELRFIPSGTAVDYLPASIGEG